MVFATKRQVRCVSLASSAPLAFFRRVLLSASALFVASVSLRSCLLPAEGSCLLLHRRPSPFRVLAALTPSLSSEDFGAPCSVLTNSSNQQRLLPLKPFSEGRTDSSCRDTSPVWSVESKSKPQALEASDAQPPQLSPVDKLAFSPSLMKAAEERGGSGKDKVSVTVGTACGVSALDKKWELVLPKRASAEEVLRQIQRRLTPRPPFSILRLLHDGRRVLPQETLESLLKRSAEEEAVDASLETLSFTLDLPFPPASSDEEPLEPSAKGGASECTDTREEEALFAAHLAAAGSAMRLAGVFQAKASDILRKNSKLPQSEALHQNASPFSTQQVLEDAIFGDSSLPLQCSEAFCSSAEALLKVLSPQEPAEAPHASDKEHGGKQQDAGAEEDEEEEEEKEKEKEQLEFFPPPPRTAAQWLQRKLRLSFAFRLDTLLKVAAGSIGIQILVSHATPVVQTPQQQKMQRLRETLILSAAPLWLVLHWRPVLQIQRFAFALLPKGRAWRALRLLLPPAYAALLEEQRPPPLERQVKKEQRQRQSNLLLTQHGARSEHEFEGQTKLAQQS